MNWEGCDMLIVQKYGGTSLAGMSRLRAAARVLGPVIGAMLLLFILQFADTGLRALISNGVIPDTLLSSTDVAQIRFVLVGIVD